MGDGAGVLPVDPFAPRPTRMTALASRLGCTEGQAYSMLIGLLLLWVVSANALPDVVWERGAEVAAPVPAISAVPEGQSPGPLSYPPQMPPLAPPTFSVWTPPPFTPMTDAPDPAPTPGPGSTPSGDTPLTVTAAGYASAGAGTPLASLGVPDGGVPVTQRAGQPYNVAYLALAGSGPQLVLKVHPEGFSSPAALAGLQLCLVTETNWKVGRGDKSLADAPKYDCANAVTGVAAADGSNWSFPMAGLDLEAMGGVAIIPLAEGTSPEFQVIFDIGS